MGCFISDDTPKAVDRFAGTAAKNGPDCLGSGPVNMTAMAFDMARDARKSPKSGVVPPVEDFDAADRRQIDRPSGRADLHGLQRRKALKGFSLPAALLLVSVQIRSDHCSHIDRS